MAVNIDNLDDVVKQLAKMEKAVELDIIREVRKRFRATMRSLEPGVKKITPSKSGNLADSLKVQSRSRRGISNVRLIWKLVKMPPETVASFAGINIKKDTQPKFINYGGVVNFKAGQSGEKFASNYWSKIKESLDQQGSSIVKNVFKEVLEKYGVKVDNK